MRARWKLLLWAAVLAPLAGWLSLPAQEATPSAPPLARGCVNDSGSNTCDRTLIVSAGGQRFLLPPGRTLPGEARLAQRQACPAPYLPARIERFWGLWHSWGCLPPPRARR
ncbi:hypothetical protein [Pseudoroseicyclus aestuarii]|uniref:Uncharacterized protein n=1 Tax=Pseudoroseicyclus aestuarii TaxID=1795041 RepID=A0A318SMV3_9RHOB|nr:hypothetical protein [Pseudoroseicyclus aestuarii]PYE81283.1 hypothetical protein DFP88_10773 [Pseudoroseicyclus aestuarii]